MDQQTNQPPAKKISIIINNMQLFTRIMTSFKNFNGYWIAALDYVYCHALVELLEQILPILLLVNLLTPKFTFVIPILYFFEHTIQTVFSWLSHFCEMEPSLCEFIKNMMSFYTNWTNSYIVSTSVI